MAEITTRKYRDGKLVSEKTEPSNWEPNEADLDVVTVGCDCGNRFTLPYDAVGFIIGEKTQCGQCGKSGTLKVINDPEAQS